MAAVADAPTATPSPLVGLVGSISGHYFGPFDQHPIVFLPECQHFERDGLHFGEFWVVDDLFALDLQARIRRRI